MLLLLLYIFGVLALKDVKLSFMLQQDTDEDDQTDQSDQSSNDEIDRSESVETTDTESTDGFQDVSDSFGFPNPFDGTKIPYFDSSVDTSLLQKKARKSSRSVFRPKNGPRKELHAKSFSDLGPSLSLCLFGPHGFGLNRNHCDIEQIKFHVTPLQNTQCFPPMSPGEFLQSFDMTNSISFDKSVQSFGQPRSLIQLSFGSCSKDNIGFPNLSNDGYIYALVPNNVNAVKAASSIGLKNEYAVYRSVVLFITEKANDDLFDIAKRAVSDIASAANSDDASRIIGTYASSISDQFDVKLARIERTDTRVAA